MSKKSQQFSHSEQKPTYSGLHACQSEPIYVTDAVHMQVGLVSAEGSSLFGRRCRLYESQIDKLD